MLVPKEKKSSQSVSVKKENSTVNTSLPFHDNRKESANVAQFQHLANKSSNSKKIAQLQELSRPKKKQNGLPDQLKSGIEQLSGIAMDDVTVHRNSSKPAQLQAHAYAQGTNIHLAPGQEKHLAHEAWHVVQQKQGRVKPTLQMKGNIAVNDDASLEREADVMGAKAVQMKLDNATHTNGCGCDACSGVVVQKKDDNVIQRCHVCGNSNCKKGEICRKPPSGLFTPNSGSWNAKFYNQKQGHGGKPTEWEHPVPGKSYRDAGLGKSYKSAPVLQIPKSMHRGGVSGIGGGISSTGSSHSAKQWSSGMGRQLKSGDFGGVIWKGVIDGMNAALVTGEDLQTAANGYYRIIMMHYHRGDINEHTAQQLIQQLMNALHNQLSRPDLYGGPKHPGPGSGPPPGSGGGITSH